jgi:hypothetical protein
MVPECILLSATNNQDVLKALKCESPTEVMSSGLDRPENLLKISPEQTELIRQKKTERATQLVS